MSDFEEFWSLYPKGREYGFRSDDYAGGRHRGQDIPGAVDGHEWIGKKIPILRPGRLIHTTQKTKLGGVYVYAVEDGEYDIYCHTHPFLDGIRLSNWSDALKWRGTSYRGPHLHLVRSRFADAGWNDSRPTLDPRVIIRARLRALTETPTSGGKPTPGPTPIPIPEVLMAAYTKAKKDTRVFEVSTGRKFHIGPEAWKAINAAAKKAGVKLPYDVNVLTIAEVEKIPDAVPTQSLPKG